MYGAGIAGNRERIMQHIGALRRNRAMLTQRARAAIDLLAADPRCDGRIAVVGYCLGGMIALELARAGAGLAGVVCMHGSLQTSQPATAGVIQAKILVCHGALDPHGPTAHVAAFADEMNNAGADYQLNLYGGAMHGFTHESAVQPVNGVAYNAIVDARSGQAAHAFLNEVFGTQVD
jgi:dienelactone hydrolase